jgi:ElaB/YqjD/DUF883 family membrane-anchored ribosome-binding protein
MKTDILERTGNQIKADLTDIAEAARDISAKVKDGLNDTREDVQRAVRKAKVFTEEGVAETRQRIKENPFTSVAAVAGGAFALGLLTGWLVARKRT